MVLESEMKDISSFNCSNINSHESSSRSSNNLPRNNRIQIIEETDVKTLKSKFFSNSVKNC